VAAAGPLGGPLVILLHGFPDLSYGWRKQIAYLADRGFRVLAPDQRGFGKSDKPREVPAYRIDELARDVLGLIDASGRERAHVVGHDWGGGVAWRLAINHPERIERFVAVNCPHPSVMMRSLRENPRQLWKSWYMLLFQIPGIPEWRLGGEAGHARLARAVMRSARPGTFSDEDLAVYREAWAEPGAMRAMLAWYRAAFRGGHAPAARRKVPVPTLLIWGARDVFLGRELVAPSLDRCDDARVQFFEDATHWVHLEQAERVNELLGEFLEG
jgi:epoxide hydrolase 4